MTAAFAFERCLGQRRIGHIEVAFLNVRIQNASQCDCSLIAELHV
jgi:hypothetical protein